MEGRSNHGLGLKKGMKSHLEEGVCVCVCVL
jgi:hypothetical protein